MARRGNNSRGNKGNRGGAFARKKGLYIDFSVFEDFASQLDDLGADLKEVFTDAMEESGQKVARDTKEAVKKAYLPAKGEFSRGDTEKAIVNDPKVEWSGSLGIIGLGFDKTKNGAGGFLITGTPKMKPDYELEKIYSQKKYERDLTKDIMEGLQAEINDRLKGFK